MDIMIVLIIVALVLILVGVVGSIMPVLPGPPFAWVALLVLRFAIPDSVSIVTLVIMFLLLIGIVVVDFLAPSWTASKSGGSKKAEIGAMVGVIAGLIITNITMWGIVLGPFLGALIGELIETKDWKHSSIIALKSLVAFLITTGIKLIYCMICLIIALFHVADEVAGWF